MGTHAHPGPASSHVRGSAPASRHLRTNRKDHA